MNKDWDVLLGIQLNNGHLIWANFHISKTEGSSSLGVSSEHRLWVNKDWDVLLGKGNSDWCWLIGHKVLKVSSGDISIHEFEEAI